MASPPIARIRAVSYHHDEGDFPPSNATVTPTHALLLLTTFADAPGFSQIELVAGAIRLGTGFAIAFGVWRLTRRLPWPRPFRLRFALMHLAVAPALAIVWLLASKALFARVTRGGIPVDFDRWDEFLLIGITVYMLVAGFSYAVEATGRAARAEALAARTQLAALRAQLHPHFLFNALHTVVQLIPVEPARAVAAAELIADLLRSAVEEQRDVVTLDDEWRFVSRYLAVEQIRFGDRLAIRTGIAPELLDARVPSFALQTLVENAVRHGATPRIAPTEIVVTAVGRASEIVLSVRNTGEGLPSSNRTIGTGLDRLRERLAVLYGSAARLSCRPLEDGGYEAMLVVPRLRGLAP